MPIYEYTCHGCAAQFEHLVRSAADERDVECPECGAKRVERRPSVVAAPRSGAARATPTPLPRGGCGRCGDPNGPCGLD